MLNGALAINPQLGIVQCRVRLRGHIVGHNIDPIDVWIDRTDVNIALAAIVQRAHVEDIARIGQQVVIAQRFAQLRHQQCVILDIARGIIRHRLIPRQTGELPIDVDTVDTPLLAEVEAILRKLLAVGIRLGHRRETTKFILGGIFIVRRSACEREQDFETRFLLFQIDNLLETRLLALQLKRLIDTIFLHQLSKCVIDMGHILDIGNRRAVVGYIRDHRTSIDCGIEFIGVQFRLLLLLVGRRCRFGFGSGLRLTAGRKCHRQQDQSHIQ